MNVYEALVNREEKMAIIGLGYVGLPLAVAFAKCVDVIGFDLDHEKIDLYCSGVDPTNEVGDDAIFESSVCFTTDELMLKKAKFHIVAVPTPISADKKPDLTAVEEASRLIGRHLMSGSLVVYESTVYPGVTEDICVPILEKESGLVHGRDFKVGYSPERINPGDRVHTLDKIIKIVSGMDEASCAEIAKVYELIIEVGVYKANSIKVAEAAKVLENSQRDVNIAFMNEAAMVFDKMNIDTFEVVEAMNTKWNALGFYPGLVGGHCIGVDPYYFTHLASVLGEESRLIATGREINDEVGEFVADVVLKKLISADKVVSKSKVAILGVTFKEDCPDIRNTKVMDLINKLGEYGIESIVVDPEADPAEVWMHYGIQLADLEDVKDADCVVFAVAHQNFKRLEKSQIDQLFKDNSEKIVIDIKSMLGKDIIQTNDYQYWSL